MKRVLSFVLSYTLFTHATFAQIDLLQDSGTCSLRNHTQMSKPPKTYPISPCLLPIPPGHFPPIFSEKSLQPTSFNQKYEVDNTVDFGKLIESHNILSKAFETVMDAINNLQSLEDFSKVLSMQGPESSKNPFFLILKNNSLKEHFDNRLSYLIKKSKNPYDLDTMLSFPELEHYIMNPNNKLKSTFTRHLQKTIKEIDNFNELSKIQEYPKLWAIIQANTDSENAFNQKLTKFISISTDPMIVSVALCSYICERLSSRNTFGVDQFIKKINSLADIIQFTNSPLLKTNLQNEDLNFHYENAISRVMTQCVSLSCLDIMTQDAILLNIITRSNTLTANYEKLISQTIMNCTTLDCCDSITANEEIMKTINTTQTLAFLFNRKRSILSRGDDLPPQDFSIQTIAQVLTIVFILAIYVWEQFKN